MGHFLIARGTHSRHGISRAAPQPVRLTRITFVEVSAFSGCENGVAALWNWIFVLHTPLRRFP
jgi:hypothetical protein